jgi:hypothetical protein
VTVEPVNNQQWRAVLCSLNIKSFEEIRSSMIVTQNNSLCTEHIQIYLDQINTSYWAIQSEYSKFLDACFM